MRVPEAEPPKSRGWLAAVVTVAAVLGGAFLYRYTVGPEDPEPGASASASGSAVAVAPPRCNVITQGPGFAVGKVTAQEAAEPPAPGLDTEASNRDALLLPFAVVVGRAVSFDGGYALGALGEGDGGTASFLVTIAPDGATGESRKILRSRGDLDPPVVAAPPGQAGLFVAALEPHASGRAIRLLRVQGPDLTWGAEILEDRDESLAFDLAVTARRGLVAWDTVEDDQSVVHVAGFALDRVGEITSQREATDRSLYADSPRVVASDNGFYLAYLVHGEQTRRERVADRGPDGSPSEGKKKSRTTDDGAGEIDETRGGEAVQNSWIEVVPLDESGAQTSKALRVTPEGVIAVSFDVAPGPDGSLIVAYRDDDSPTGGSGGIIRMVNLRAAGLGASYESQEPLPSDGVPSLLSGWMGVPVLADTDLLVKLGKDGMPAEPLVREPSLGPGEPVAATGNRLLLAVPGGAAMRFRVVECSPELKPFEEEVAP